MAVHSNSFDASRWLPAIESIRVLKARYFRYIDTKQWQSLRTLFAPGCIIEFESTLTGVSAMRRWNSGDEFVDVVAVRHADTIAVHHGFMPEISLTGEHTASGIWAMHDTVIRSSAADAPSFEGYGHYHETYVLLDDDWRIASMRLTRLYERVLEHQPQHGV